MLDNLPVDLLLAITSVATVIASLMAVTQVVLIRWLARRDQRIKGAQLTETRAYYEEKISQLVERLTATKDRWQDVNHLVMAGQDIQRDSFQLFNTDEIPIFRDMGISKESTDIDPSLVFVLTPVLKEEEAVYSAIVLAVERFGLRAVRSDFEVDPGDILRQIVVLIAKCRFVIANVSNRNPNVYYELGIAHALGKNCILVSRTVDTLSFDIASRRVVTFSDYRALSAKLVPSIEATLKSDYKALATK